MTTLSWFVLASTVAALVVMAVGVIAPAIAPLAGRSAPPWNRWLGSPKPRSRSPGHSSSGSP